MIIGVTGNTGAGKSTVANILREKLKIKVLNADKIARQALHKKNVRNALVMAFGSSVITNYKISRKNLAHVAFSSPSNVKKLNSITHPTIRKEIIRQMKNNIIIDAPLLIEGGFYKKCDYVILVKCNTNKILKRTQKRKYDVKERIRHQMDFEKKKRYADFVIDNNGSLKETREQLKNIISKLKNY